MVRYRVSGFYLISKKLTLTPEGNMKIIKLMLRSCRGEFARNSEL